MPDSNDAADIRGVIASAAYLSDEGSPDDYHLVYTEDARSTLGDVTQSGLEEIKAATRQRRESGATGPGSKTRHFVTTVRVEVDGDSATATSYFMFVAATDSAPTIRKVAMYDDALVRTDAGWRIRQRVARSD